MKVRSEIGGILQPEMEIDLSVIKELEFNAKDHYARIWTPEYVIESYDAKITADGFDLGGDIAVTKMGQTAK